MTRKRDRAAATFLAILFLVTSVGFSVLVIFQMKQDGKKAEETAAIQEALAKAQGQPDDACGTEPVSGDVIPAPEVYKPAADVTALETVDLEPGTGAAIAAGSCASMKYYGTLAADGTVFDENFSTADTYTFRVGQGGVIQGWDQGLIGLKEGGTRRLVIPSDLAYGTSGNDTIPPNTDLVFVVKAVKVAE